MLNVARDRILRYQQRLQWIVERIENLPPLDENNTNFDFFLDSLFYRLQTSIDGIMDIVAMLCKDLGEEVGDDYNNLETLN